MILALFKDGNFETLYKDIKVYPEFAILQGYRGFSFETLFRYIYFVCDRNSYPNKEGYPDNEIREYALRNSGLPTNFKDDTVIKKAMGKYRELSFSTISELSKTLAKSINNTYRTAAKLEELVNELLDNHETSPLGEELSDVTDPEEKLKVLERLNKYKSNKIKDALNYTNQVFELVDKTKKYLTMVKEIQDEADRIETGGGSKLLGGGTVKSSMTPNNSIEGNDISNDDLIVS